NGINDLVIKKQFQEERKIQILVATQRVEQKQENVILTKNITPYYHYEINYVRFLSQVSSLLPANSQLLVKLEEDLITNANKLISQPEQKIWPEFDYILVDECQDLKAETLRLITKIFGSEDTSFTFVGDPKQNIYGFAGATEDIFTLLEQQFPQQTQSIIATSFRLSPEIAEYSNDFIKKFMTYRASIQTTKPRTGQQPQIFIVGQDPDYQLSPHEVIEIEQEVAMNTTIKRNDLVQNKIRQKKLHQHLEVVLQLINQLDKFSSKAILYRQN
ncbi:16454_t:CDS:2, partial [Funneliformis geosporum]